jgi:amidophosphoribosyltransferase
MSDPLRHECGIALVRLRKPLAHYQERYGSPLWGLLKLFLLMEKQHNRGQDGAGVAAVKLDVPAGEPFMFRQRSIRPDALDRIFSRLLERYRRLVDDRVVRPAEAHTVREHFDFGGEVLLGHLRYGTSGGYTMSACHPFFRRSAWPARNLILAGNFNITNARELNARLIAMGQHPILATDTQALLEYIGLALDEAHEAARVRAPETVSVGESAARGGEAGPGTPPAVQAAVEGTGRIDVAGVLRQASIGWDGGYSLVGLIGSGDCFVMRDPSGIRPAFWYADDDVVAVASERVALMTGFDCDATAVREVSPGHAVIVTRDGAIEDRAITEPRPRTSCSFERIYFSRGNDPDIYRERKALGAGLADQVLAEIEEDLERAVFGFIPNTAEAAYLGLLDELRLRRRQVVRRELLAAAADGRLDEVTVDRLILRGWPRAEKIAVKDLKMRTFIGSEKWRAQLAPHIYDVSYGTVGPDDTLVVVDDSIVRGTTLRRSIIRTLARLGPRRLVIVSTAPQIRYPDCYGIDMSELGKFIAFEAAVALLQDRGSLRLLDEVYQACRSETGDRINHVQRIYEPFTAEEISTKIAALVRPPGLAWGGDIRVVFQTIEHLHAALPAHTGDWYFTGRYPTPGGFRVVNRAYVNYYEHRNERGY